MSIYRFWNSFWEVTIAWCEPKINFDKRLHNGGHASRRVDFFVLGIACRYWSTDTSRHRARSELSTRGLVWYPLGRQAAGARCEVKHNCIEVATVSYNKLLSAADRNLLDSIHVCRYLTFCVARDGMDKEDSFVWVTALAAVLFVIAAIAVYLML